MGEVHDVIIATILKNEAHRYLRGALEVWSDFADAIVAIDNGSEDESRDILGEFPKVVDVTPPVGASQRMWGKEAKWRQYLFEMAMAEANEGDVVFWLDADMIPMVNPREFFCMPQADAWAFTLFDLWGVADEDGALLYRSDSFWRGHEVHRTWAVRKADHFDPESYVWSPRGIHTGHLPANYTVESLMMVPKDWSLLHYGYYTEADRQERHARYTSVRHQLNDFERAHAGTILDPSPSLERLELWQQYSLLRATEKVV